MSLAEVKALLGKLTDEELQQVTMLATALRTRADKTSELIDWYEAVSQALLTKVEWRVPPLRVLPDKTQKQLRQTYYQLLNWFDDIFDPPLTKIERKWALNLVAELLSESLLERNRPLCLNGILNAVPDIPGVVDQAFPGYISSGALRWVLRASRHTGVVE